MTDPPAIARKSVIAIDPGIFNMGVWKGYMDQSTGKPVTQIMKKVDIGRNGTLPERTCVFLETDECFTDEGNEDIFEYIIETQKGNNRKASTVSYVLYAFLRARGKRVRFSGIDMKRYGMEYLCKILGTTISPHAHTGTGLTKKQMYQNYTTNKNNARHLLLLYSRDPDTPQNIVDIINTAAHRGKAKIDDIADAMLLGIGSTQLVSGQRASRPTKKLRSNGYSIKNIDTPAPMATCNIDCGIIDLSID